MNRDDIIRMAKKAGFYAKNINGVEEITEGDGYYIQTDEILDFAELVAAAEREAIAKRFDGPVWSYDYREIAAAIRARSE